MPTIAILGASRDRAKFGNKAVRAFAEKGYQVYPVHPKETEIEGHKVYRSVAEIPVPTLDMISVYLPPEIGLKVLPEIARKPCKELWLNPGADSDALIEAAEGLGLNVIAACSLVGLGVRPSEY